MDPISRLNESLGQLTSWLYAAVFLITLWEVVLRYVFHSPTIWVLELTIMLAGIQYCIGGAYAMRRGEHVRIDVIYQLLSEKVRWVLDLVCSIIILAVLAVIIYWGLLQAHAAMTPNWQTTGGAWNSHAPVYMKIAIPVAGVLMFAQTAVSLAVQMRGRR